jgi:hypothetical protein
MINSHYCALLKIVYCGFYKGMKDLYDSFDERSI